MPGLPPPSQGKAQQRGNSESHLPVFPSLRRTAVHRQPKKGLSHSLNPFFHVPNSNWLQPTGQSVSIFLI